MKRVRIIGPGRAGRSLGRALRDVGWAADPEYRGRGDELGDAAVGVDVVVIATPDDVIAAVADAIGPVAGTAVVHLSGSRGLEELRGHRRAGALHPLVSLPDDEVGARRLTRGAWFAVAGDPIVVEMATALGGRTFEVADEHRAAYHAAAVIASNHLVALLGQAERVGGSAGVPFEALVDLVRVTVANVADLGPAAALTGPAARGDDETIRRHLAALGDDERAAYEAMAAEARRLAGRTGPAAG